MNGMTNGVEHLGWTTYVLILMDNKRMAMNPIVMVRTGMEMEAGIIWRDLNLHMALLILDLNHKLCIHNWVLMDAEEYIYQQYV